MKPPIKIDNARVIEWAWSGSLPFGCVPGSDSTDIFGLAIATYDDSQYYRFSCDQNWNAIEDAIYNSVADAKTQLPQQYRKQDAQWIAMN